MAARRVRIRIILLAARQEPAPLEKPQGRTAGPALPSRTPMAARPFAVGGRLAVPSAYIAAEPGRVGQAPSLSKLRFARWDTTCGSAARYAERLRLSDSATFYTTCLPAREGAAVTRRKAIIFWRSRSERQSLSAKQGAKPPGPSTNLDGLGQALPLPGDRVAQGGKLQAGVAPTPRLRGRHLNGA